MPRAKRKSGSVLNGRKPGRQGEAYSIWSAVDGSVIAQLVRSATRAGASVQFGVTRDQTAATVRLYHEGVGETFYLADDQDVIELVGYYANEFDLYVDSPA